MTYEKGPEARYEFSREEIETLVDKAQRFYDKITKPMLFKGEDIDGLDSLDHDSLIMDVARIRIGSRVIRVSNEGPKDSLTISLTEYLSFDGKHMGLGRSLDINLKSLFGITPEHTSVNFDLNDGDDQFSEPPVPNESIDPLKNLKIFESVYPTTPDGDLLTRNKITPESQPHSSRVRPFTKVDYDDMTQMLEDGIAIYQ